MRHGQSVSLLMRLRFWVRPATLRQLDPADMGTAFGLEYTLAQQPIDEREVQRIGNANRPRAWLRRLTGEQQP